LTEGKEKQGQSLGPESRAPKVRRVVTVAERLIRAKNKIRFDKAKQEEPKEEKGTEEIRRL